MKVTVYHEIDGIEYEIQAKVEFGNDGIGAYECHGFKGFDRGKTVIDEIIIESIKNDKGNLDHENFNASDDLIWKIETKAFERLEDEPDYPEKEIDI